MVNNKNATPTGCASIDDFMFYMSVFQETPIAVDVLGNIFSALRKNTMLRARDYPITSRLVDHFDVLGQMAADFPERNRLLILDFFYKALLKHKGEKRSTHEALESEMSNLLARPWEH